MKNKAFQELTDEEHAAGMGGRTGKQVHKQLSDQKSNTRRKAAIINRERQKKGGGQAVSIPLKPIEKLLLSTVNPHKISGIINDGESGGTIPSSDSKLRGQSIYFYNR